MVSEPCIKHVPFDIVHPTPVNNRRDSLKGFDDLCAAIRKQGVLQFPILRPHPSIVNEYEIVCGERRCRACGELGIPITARVENYSDEDAHEITVMENMQREDLTPIEESRGIVTLLNDGKTLEQVADKLGKSVRWVARRAKLADLSEKFMEALDDPDDKYGIQRWTGSHLELIARFDTHVQDSYFTECIESGWEQEVAGMSLEALREHLESYMLNMSSAPWELDDPDYDSGACSECPKRTSVQVNLFEDNDGTDRCIDRICWCSKMEVFLIRKESSLRSNCPDLLLVDKSYGDGFLPHDHFLKERAVNHYQCHDVRKGAPKACPALIVDGAGVGTVKYVELYGTGQSTGSAGRSKTLAERREQLEKKRRELVIASVIDVLEKEQKSPDHIINRSDAEILSAAVIWGAIRQEYSPEGDMAFSEHGQGTWADYWELKKRELGDDCLVIELMRCVIPRWIQMLRTDLNYTRSVDLTNAQRICEWLGIDITYFIQDAKIKKPEPKSWAKLERAEKAAAEKNRGSWVNPEGGEDVE